MSETRNLLYMNNGQQTDWHSHGLPSDRRWSISADLVQSRFSQIGPRSVSELESVLTLVVVILVLKNTWIYWQLLAVSCDENLAVSIFSLLFGHSFYVCHIFIFPSIITVRQLCQVQYMPSSCVCVCLSVTLRYCIKTAQRRIMQITTHDSPLTLVFWHQSSLRHSKGITPYGSDKCRWGGLKFVTFDKKRNITRKRYKIDV